MVHGLIKLSYSHCRDKIARYRFCSMKNRLVTKIMIDGSLYMTHLIDSCLRNNGIIIRCKYIGDIGMSIISSNNICQRDASYIILNFNKLDSLTGFVSIFYSIYYFSKIPTILLSFDIVTIL